MIKWSCIDFSTSALKGNVLLSESSSCFNGIAMKAKRNSIDTAKMLFSCLNLKIIRPTKEIIHMIGADLWVIIVNIVSMMYKI